VHARPFVTKRNFVKVELDKRSIDLINLLW